MDMARYGVMKAAEEQHYTLGVAYPADKVDAHGEFTTAEELERTAWHWMAQHRRIGIQHQDGTEGHGIPVESYIYRGPDWKVGDQVVKAGDWLLGVVWDDAAWLLIKRGILTGYSIQGDAFRKKVAAPPDGKEVS
ncbi:hypothetical protein GCM10025857_06880 [Alicyclobacillus contaminans]|nr:hypothetical protein GCM10025857_06880 [Alicyclobacillus contaminans]